MPTCVWKGGAPAVAQVITVTVGGTIETTDVFTMTINGKTLSVVGGSATAATVATTIAAAWNALSATAYPEFAEITALATTGGAFTLTSNTAGVPFAVTLATTETGGGAADNQTFTQATTVANSGPNDWSTAANWSGGAVPVNSDVVIIENSQTDILYGLAQSGVTVASLTVKQDFLGTIGLPRVNATGYVEYRDTYLAIGATAVSIGNGEGIGSGRIKLNLGTVQSTVNVLNTGSPIEDGVKSLILKGTHASNAVNVTKGSVAIAPFASEVATVLTLKIGYQDSQDSDSDVVCGSGVTLGGVTKNGGSLLCDTTTAAITSITQTAGTIDIRGSTNAVTSLTVYGGTAYYSTSGTATQVVVGPSAVLDFRRDMRAKTVTDALVYSGGEVHDPAAVVTWSNGLDLLGCGLEDCSLDLGKHRTWTPSGI